jgi:hypothetical protein
VSARCVGEAVSWLRLERYHLGEIAGDERERIAGHLAACPACAACLARIEQDEGVALPALRPMPDVPSRQLASPAGAMRARWLRLGGAGAGALAAVAAVVLYLRATPHPVDGGPLASGRVKGDAAAFSLVRDDGSFVGGEGGLFHDGDRFKAVVTCPPGAGLTFDVVVYDRGGASFPLEPAASFACGNEAPLPGAFRLTGRDEERVCLVWGAAGAVPREALASDVRPPEGASRACIALKPAE